MSLLNLLRDHGVFTLAAVTLVACGGDVGSDTGPSGASTGGNWVASTGGTSGVGGATIIIGGAFPVGGSSGAPSTLPWKCTQKFDPGYSCSSSPYTQYQYDQATGACVLAQYNGCGGSSSGYPDLRSCQAQCEQRPSDGDCPLYFSEGTACSTPGMFCMYGGTSYAYSDCLCTVAGYYGCQIPDPRCSSSGLNSKRSSNPGCTGETCTIVQDIVILQSRVCSCDAGTWTCSYLY